MDTLYIDINCDVGEGIGNEGQLMPFITSCSIACGGHSGTDSTMRRVAGLAKEYGVKVGAHPSYPDRENFGRLSMHISEAQLMESIQMQMTNFSSILSEAKIPLHHIKPHGALYNDIATNLNLAKAFLRSILNYKDDVFLYVPYKSVILAEAIKQGFQIKREAFVDRNYNDDATLVSRKLPNALITDPEQVLKNLIGMVKNKQVKSLNGNPVKIEAETYCIHGDTTSVFKILSYLSQELPKANIRTKE